MTIVFIMLFSIFVTVISNISIASQTNVTVVINADRDSSLTKSEDGTKLTYSCEDESTYTFSLVKNGTTEISFKRETTDLEGVF